MAGVPITVLLYDGPLPCGFNVAIKGLIILAVGGGALRNADVCFYVCMFPLPIAVASNDTL